jgi:hypothetical protein
MNATNAQASNGARFTSRLGVDPLVDPLAETDPNGLLKTVSKQTKRLPEVPLSLLIARRVSAAAHTSRTFVAEHPMLSLAIAGGAGVLVGRMLPRSVQRKIGFGVATFLVRRLVRIVFNAIEDSTPEAA